TSDPGTRKAVLGWLLEAYQKDGAPGDNRPIPAGGPPSPPGGGSAGHDPSGRAGPGGGGADHTGGTGGGSGGGSGPDPDSGAGGSKDSSGGGDDVKKRTSGIVSTSKTPTIRPTTTTVRPTTSTRSPITSMRKPITSTSRPTPPACSVSHERPASVSPQPQSGTTTTTMPIRPSPSRRYHNVQKAVKCPHGYWLERATLSVTFSEDTSSYALITAPQHRRNTKQERTLSSEYAVQMENHGNIPVEMTDPARARFTDEVSSRNAPVPGAASLARSVQEPGLLGPSSRTQLPTLQQQHASYEPSWRHANVQELEEEGPEPQGCGSGIHRAIATDPIVESLRQQL
ncbi:hypothetical protein QBC35DRAFT_543723, partial [Podospora australis]